MHAETPNPEEGQLQSQGNPPPSNSSTTQASAQPGTSQGDSASIFRKISAIEAQISQLCTARDLLQSKLGAQERELASIRGDTLADRSKVIDDTMKQMESRLSQQLVEAEAQRSRTSKLLDAERQRVARLEGQLEILTQRLGILESRLAASELPSAAGVSATSSSSIADPNVTQPGIDPAAFLDFSSESKDDFAPALLMGNKRAAPLADEERTRASKRARHEPHTYTTAARLEDALTHPVSPASAPAASSSLPSAPTAETPRTPPMTRHQRRQLALPPGSPSGPTPSQMRFVGAMPPSPTTDSPRKGVKGKGKDAVGGSLLLASPAKVKKVTQASKTPAKDTSAAVPPAGVTSPHPPPASLLAGPSDTAPPTSSGDPAARTRAPSTSPAFPVYEPPSRFTRRAGQGTSLGLGRPSVISRTNNTATAAPSPAPPPGGLLPAFSLAGRPYHSGLSTADETDETNTNGTTPGGEIVSADEMLAIHQEPVTPMLSAVGVGSMNDSWVGAPGFNSPEDGPPSPDKRTLYGTEVLPSERRGSGRVREFPPEDDWM